MWRVNCALAMGRMSGSVFDSGALRTGGWCALTYDLWGALPCGGSWKFLSLKSGLASARERRTAVDSGLGCVMMRALR